MLEIKKDTWSGEFTIFNMGCEYVEYRLDRFFRDVEDVRGIVDRLKSWELESKQILLSAKHKQKYAFVPLETHQVFVYIGMRQGS